ncbi:MAG: DUF6057 family protein [Tannerellaceae bacterium]|jgi:hypothetical protein|nr:DUF6057 family protein [Tannerellaceae bacterium]
MTIERREIWTRIITAFVFAVCCFSFFQFLLPYHLFFKEQTQLFLLTAEYFISYFEKPASLAAYIGDFLTQFFYLRGGGAVTITIVLLVEWWLVVVLLERTGLKKKVSLLALIPVLFDGILHCELFYSLSISVAVILVLFSFLVYTWIQNKWRMLVYGILILPLLYVISGAVFLLFPLLVIIYEINKRRVRPLYWLLLTGIAAVFPYLMKQVYLLTIKQAYRYPLATLGMRGVNFTREKVLALSSEAYFGNWERVYELANEDKLSNFVATYYANIALSKRNELPDKLLDYYQPFSQGLFLEVGPNSNWIDIFFSSDVFFHLGDMNMAQHSAMLGKIFSPKHRSSRMIKRLAEINLVNNDSTATRKYLRILEATWFHRKWAVEHERMLTGKTEDYPWLKAKRSQIPTYDALRLSSDYPAALNVLIESNPDNTYALDYLLCFYLLNKDIRSFGEVFDKWCKGKSYRKPDLYYQALLIKLVASQATQKEVASYAIPATMMNDFLEYTRIYEQSNGDLEQLRRRFGATYWFYYHFARMQKQ